MLRRAVDSGEEYVKKILEITLRHDLDMYNQSKALETLLAFQCKFSCVIIFVGHFCLIIKNILKTVLESTTM